MNSLTPSLCDLWVKVVGREPGDSQHPTAAGIKSSALEHPFTVQAGACPVDERAALHMASPLRAMVFSTFPEIPVNLSCLSCQPEQRRRLHFDSCSWKIQLPPSSSSPFCPPPTCLKKKRGRAQLFLLAWASDTHGEAQGLLQGKAMDTSSLPRHLGQLVMPLSHGTLNLKLALSPHAEMCGQVPAPDKSK